MAKGRRQVGIGIVGMGFMGTTHLAQVREVRGARLAAIVTSDPRKARGDFRGIRGNFGSGLGRVDLGGVAVYPSLEPMLQDPGVDLVDICLPSHLHAPAALRALEGGKHVLVEKPIAVRPAEARQMLASARRRRRLLMVGQVLKFFPEFAWLAAAIRSRRYGELLGLHLARRISAPSWGEGSWFADPGKSGGMVVDLHIHDTDLVVHLLGKPQAVSSSGLVRNGRVDFLRTVYLGLDGGALVSSEAGWINAPGLAFVHAYDAYFEHATCHFDSSRGPAPRLYGKKGWKDVVCPGGDGFRAELDAAVRAVQAGQPAPGLDAASALASLEVCLAEEKSVRTGRAVRL